MQNTVTYNHSSQAVPVLIEEHHDSGIDYLVSFGGPNPTEDKAVKLDKAEAVKLMQLLGHDTESASRLKASGYQSI